MAGKHVTISPLSQVFASGYEKSRFAQRRNGPPQLAIPPPLGQTPPVKKDVAKELEAELNPEQIAAVTHGMGPQLVLAGAGSGKTRVITYRIYWLIEERGVDPGHIAAMTFTNKATGEMRERVADLLGMHPLSTSVGTFHRYGLIL